jgi:hypothetical protein
MGGSVVAASIAVGALLKRIADTVALCPLFRRMPAGLIAIDLARQTLQLFPDSYALVVSHENLTNNW